MNLKVIFLLCLVAVLLFSDAEGGWGRRRRRRRRRCVLHCPLVCYGYRCTIHNGGLVCYRLCRKVCRTVCYGKREVPAEGMPGDAGMPPEDAGMPPEDDPEKKASSRSRMKLIPQPLPDKFSNYDSNNDGKISYKEFKKALPHVKNNKVIRKGFDIIDRNGDSHIDCEEFLKSHLNVLKAEAC